MASFASTTYAVTSLMNARKRTAPRHLRIQLAVAQSFDRSQQRVVHATAAWRLHHSLISLDTGAARLARVTNVFLVFETAKE